MILGEHKHKAGRRLAAAMQSAVKKSHPAIKKSSGGIDTKFQVANGLHGKKPRTDYKHLKAHHLFEASSIFNCSSSPDCRKGEEGEVSAFLHTKIRTDFRFQLPCSGLSSLATAWQTVFGKMSYKDASGRS